MNFGFITNLRSNISSLFNMSNQSTIKVNVDTNNPQKAWEKLRSKLEENKVACNSLPLDTPIYPNKVRFVCISDTHSNLHRMTYEIPHGDVLLHAGDFTKGGSLKEVENFNEFLGTLDNKFKYKVVIAGNHELSFERKDSGVNSLFKHLNKNEDQLKDPRELLTNCIYLEEKSVKIYGINIYGAPWQPWFGGWAFNVERGEKILEKWNKIPDDVDILITHGPPLGFGDIVSGGFHVGCCELLSTIQERVKPKYHVFGHIHEDYGIWTDSVTTFINPSTCDRQYRPCRAPIIFDIDLPDGFEKTLSDVNST